MGVSASVGEGAAVPVDDVANSEGDALLRLVGVAKTYLVGETEVRALRGVDLEIIRGDYVAIMGPSGSGKSTLLHLLGCLDTPSQGSYWFNGREVSTYDDDALTDVRNRDIGFIFQSFQLLPRLDALRNVELPLIYSEVEKSERIERAQVALERVGLADRSDHRPNQLSGGEQQRVAIARALVNDPAIVLADEPTGNLDSETSTEVMSLLDELNHDGTTIVLVTHEGDIAEHARDRVVMHDGNLEWVA